MPRKQIFKQVYTTRRCRQKFLTLNKRRSRRSTTPLNLRRLRQRLSDVTHRHLVSQAPGGRRHALGPADPVLVGRLAAVVVVVVVETLRKVHGVYRTARHLARKATTQ